MTEEAAATAASTDVLRPPEVAINEESWYSTESRDRASIMALAALQISENILVSNTIRIRTYYCTYVYIIYNKYTVHV